MREFWVYDWEVYYNFCCVTFIHSTTPKYLIDAYIEVDILYLDIKHKLENLSDEELLSDEYSELKQTLNKYILAKQEIFGQMISKSFIIYRDRNDSTKNICQLGELIMFFTNHKVLIGYNSYNYDSYITDFILANGRDFDYSTGKNPNNIHITEALKQASDEIISVSKDKLFGYKYSWLHPKYKRLYEDYDIQKILYLDKSFVGLKSVAINLKWHRIQELPLPPDSIIEYNQLFDVYDYNINDVLITYKLLWNQEEEVKLRQEISERYDINVLNESRSSIGKRLMSKYYEDVSGVPYAKFKDLRTHRGRMKMSSIISDKIKFETTQFKDFLNNILKLTVSPDDDFNRLIEFNGTFYTVAKGGLHSVDDSRLYDNNDGYIYKDADVTSYYPSIIEIFKIAPAHLNANIFLYLISYFKNDRVKAKHEGRKLEAEALKIVINRIYGALKDMMDYLFDPKATYQTTFNGQLSLLMLIEKLEVHSNGNIHCISANTDGIVCRFKPEYENLYSKLCKEWEVETGFELEYTDYEKYVRNNVNEYVAIKKGFRDEVNKLLKSKNINDNIESELSKLESKYVKGKGDYISETPFNKGFVHPIVSIALRNYILYNKDYKDTIYNHWKESRFNIYDYCISQKVDKKFNVYFNTVVDGKIKNIALQQYNRFYVCTKNGGSITKESDSSIHRLIAGKTLRIFNDYIHLDNYDIDYNYYIKQVEMYLYYRKKNSKGNHKHEGILVRGKTLFDNEHDG